MTKSLSPMDLALIDERLSRLWTIITIQPAVDASARSEARQGIYDIAARVGIEEWRSHRPRYDLMIDLAADRQILLADFMALHPQVIEIRVIGQDMTITTALDFLPLSGDPFTIGGYTLRSISIEEGEDYVAILAEPITVANTPVD